MGTFTAPETPAHEDRYWFGAISEPYLELADRNSNRPQPYLSLTSGHDIIKFYLASDEEAKRVKAGIANALAEWQGRYGVVLQRR